MRLLYVFPHPDDESFGPAAAMARQRRQGHDVHLLTLTRGGATMVRHELGLDVEGMGEVRRREMEAMARVLDLSSLEVLDFPDDGLAELDPRLLENAVADRVRSLDPDVVVTYPVHGISGFADHLVAHAVVKRAICALGESAPRLAFVTLEEAPGDGRRIPLTASAPARIDCVVNVSDEDLDLQRRALDCYRTFRTVVAELDPMAVHGRRIAFEIFGETHEPPLGDLTDRLERPRPSP